MQKTSEQSELCSDVEHRNTIDASNFYCKMTSLGTLDIFLAFFFKWLKMNNKVS